MDSNTHQKTNLRDPLRLAINSIKSKLIQIKSTHADISSLPTRTAAAIEEAESWPAAASALNKRVLQLCQAQEDADKEEEKLQAQLEAFDMQNSSEQVVLSVEHILNNLGCTLLTTADADVSRVYKFDFGKERCISIKYEDTRFTLVAITPTYANFSDIKAFADSTQDLIGLLLNFGTLFACPPDQQRQ